MKTSWKSDSSVTSMYKLTKTHLYSLTLQFPCHVFSVLGIFQLSHMCSLWTQLLLSPTFLFCSWDTSRFYIQYRMTVKKDFRTTVPFTYKTESSDPRLHIVWENMQFWWNMGNGQFTFISAIYCLNSNNFLKTMSPTLVFILLCLKYIYSIINHILN